MVPLAFIDMTFDSIVLSIAYSNVHLVLHERKGWDRGEVGLYTQRKKNSMAMYGLAVLTIGPFLLRNGDLLFKCNGDLEIGIGHFIL